MALSFWITTNIREEVEEGEEMKGMLVKPAVVLCLVSSGLAKVDFYLSSDQTEALYGIETDGLYYVRDGVVNKYAMNFQHQVKPTLVQEKFHLI